MPTAATTRWGPEGVPAAGVRTWLTDRLDLAVPVIGAPMAGAAGGALAAAVSGAGGLGCVGVGSGAETGWVAEQRGLAARPARPYGVGLLAWSLDDRPELLDAVLDTARHPLPALVSLSFGDYARHVETVRSAGAFVATQVGTVAEARAADSAGVDLIVARGAEGGGHGRDLVATLPLLQAVLDAVEVPVVAAGGIGTARGLAAVLAAGAAGAWVGTAFLCCAESLFADDLVTRLGAADETATSYGRVFDVASGAGWPAEYGGRAVRNEFFDSWAGREEELDDVARERFRAAPGMRDLSTIPVYAGQGVGLLNGERRPAADVLAELGEAAALLRAAGERVRPADV